MLSYLYWLSLRAGLRGVLLMGTGGQFSIIVVTTPTRSWIWECFLLDSGHANVRARAAFTCNNANLQPTAWTKTRGPQCSFVLTLVGQIFQLLQNQSVHYKWYAVIHLCSFFVAYFRMFSCLILHLIQIKQIALASYINL